MELVQPRDKELMRVVYEEQFLMLKTISKFFFNDSFQSASLRIIKLINLRLMRYEILNLPGKPKVARLTSNGVKLCRALSPFEIKQKRKIPLSTFSHDAITSEVRLKLRESFDANWVPEKAMKAHDFKKIPDGILLFQSGRRIAVEVENSMKGSERYDRMWREWENHDFVLVLYVATTEVVFRALQRRMQVFQSTKVRLGLITLDQMMTGTNDSVWTPRGSVPLFQRRTF